VVLGDCGHRDSYAKEDYTAQKKTNLLLTQRGENRVDDKRTKKVELADLVL
jgi:hypothetical protein